MFCSYPLSDARSLQDDMASESVQLILFPMTARVGQLPCAEQDIVLLLRPFCSVTVGALFCPQIDAIGGLMVLLLGCPEYTSAVPYRTNDTFFPPFHTSYAHPRRSGPD